MEVSCRKILALVAGLGPNLRDTLSDLLLPVQALAFAGMGVVGLRELALGVAKVVGGGYALPSEAAQPPVSGGDPVHEQVLQLSHGLQLGPQALAQLLQGGFSSPGKRTSHERRPCFTAFRRTAAFPSDVLGVGAF